MGVKKTLPPPDDKNILSAAWGYISSISGGMAHTMGIMLNRILGKGKAVTIQWPEEPVTYGERFKGKHFLTLRDDGQVRCTACFLCATACPAKCIHIEAGQHPDNDIEKFPVRFEIDILRCVFCGYCEEACPVDAIRLGREYVMAGLSGDTWVYTKDHLAGRGELGAGIHSVKTENIKHPTIAKKDLGVEDWVTQAPHGGQAH